MGASPVVVAFNVGEETALGVLAGCPSLPVEEFYFPCVEEALERCIILATAGPAHRTAFVNGGVIFLSLGEVNFLRSAGGD
jgi:hypothetical protein